MWKGVINNEVDAAIASTISGQAKEAETSPRGWSIRRRPSSDKPAWARVQQDRAVLRAAQDHLRARHERDRHRSSCRAYPYPIFMAYAHAAGRPGLRNDQVDDRQLRRLQGRRAGRSGLRAVTPEPDLGRCRITTARFRRLQGGRRRGSPSTRRTTRRWFKRQATLAAAWDAYMKTSPPDDAEAFRKGWMARARRRPEEGRL